MEPSLSNEALKVFKNEVKKNVGRINVYVEKSLYTPTLHILLLQDSRAFRAF